jgi:toluene monooxygenase electron transfer component
MTHSIRIDKSDAQFLCDESDTVLRAALRAGLAFPYECNSGGCGSCKFELVEGDVASQWDDPPGLSARDLRKGKRLACQCHPAGDVVIKVRLDETTPPDQAPQRFEASYLGRRDLTADMAEFRFQAESPAQFLPGQYAMLSLPGVQGDRAYSMSNIPNEAGYWQFIIKQMPGGAGSHYMFKLLQEGDRLICDSPYGQAYLRPEVARDIVCIAGGSGLSPVMSIVRAVTSDARFSDRKIMLFYGGRGPNDICTPELLSELEPLDAQLVCHNVTSDPELSAQQNWQGECCFVHEQVEKTLGDTLPDYEYYFCGPPAMTESVQRMLMIDHQVPFQQIHFDRFF